MGQEFGEFAVDHFLPVKFRPDLLTEYSNLLYVCTRCNLRKMQRFVADPLIHLLSDSILVHSDGLLEARSRECRQIVRVVKLNDPHLVAYRRLWINIVETTRVSNPRLYRQLLTFPDDLPDLRKLQPSDGNTKPEGIEQSYFCRRERGELPETY